MEELMGTVPAVGHDLPAVRASALVLALLDGREREWRERPEVDERRCALRFVFPGVIIARGSHDAERATWVA